MRDYPVQPVRTLSTRMQQMKQISLDMIAFNQSYRLRYIHGWPAISDSTHIKTTPSPNLFHLIQRQCTLHQSCSILFLPLNNKDSSSLKRPSLCCFRCIHPQVVLPLLSKQSKQLITPAYRHHYNYI